MLKLAMKDAFNQQDLAQKAKLQVELFQKAQDFAIPTARRFRFGGKCWCQRFGYKADRHPRSFG